MLDFLQLSDSAFTKFVDGLSSEAYRSLFNSSPDFSDRINGGNSWQERRDQRELDEYITKQLQAKRDRLNRELAAGRGLSTATWTWLDQKNLRTLSLAVQQDVKQIRPIYDAFNKARGPFSETERGTLITLAQQCVGIGSVLDLTDLKSWECAFAVGIASQKIGISRTQPTPEKTEPSMADKIRGMIAEPTAQDRRRAYANDVVWQSRVLGRSLTQSDIDHKLSADELRQIVNEGYSAEGPILVHTNDLAARRARRGGRS
jgi:hypothetical protein